MPTFTATYSPDDNKLRLYASDRLDTETYAAVKAAGFRWAPKQELFVAPMWTPSREDLLIRLAGQIDDEDKSLVERAEERSDRFDGYSESRMADAESAQKAVHAITDNIPFGQPILVGHHSERHARADAKRIETGMRRAVNMWKTSTYWAERAQGCIRAAKYKELPSVRARRIKTIEADLRKVMKSKTTTEKELKAWTICAGIDDPAKQRAAALYISNGGGYWSMSFPLADFPRDPPASQYEGPMGLWSAIDGNVITAALAAAIAIPALERSLPGKDRWIEHYNNRLDYERAMLGDVGGLHSDKTKPEVGGAIKSWHAGASRWSYIQKVNKVTVTIWDTASYSERVFRANVPFDKINAIMSRAEVTVAKQEQRVREFGKGDKVVGFALLDAAPADDNPMPVEAPADFKAERVRDLADEGFEAMQATLKAGINVEVVNQLFPTPRDLAQEMADLADVQPGDRVLEPSAGTGMLLGAIGGAMFDRNPERGLVVAVEINRGLAERLMLDYPLTTVIVADFLELNGVVNTQCVEPIGPFDKIVMNPPFENAADIKHIRHAMTMLKPGGRLVAICANGPRQQAQIRPLAIKWKVLPADTFASTGVNAVLLVIERPKS